MKDERLDVLLDAYLDEALSAEEKAELERLLLESAAARKHFWERSALHAWTYQAAKLNYAAEVYAAEVATVAIPSYPREVEGDPVAENAPLALKKVATCPHCGRPADHVHHFGRKPTGFLARLLESLSAWHLKPALGVALAALGVVVWLRFFAGDPPPSDSLASALMKNQIARLTHGAGVVWADETGPEIGQALEPERLRLERGVVQIDFVSGVRAIVEGPAELQLNSSNEVALQAGRLTALVSERGRGFQVRLDDLVVTDLGTEFAVRKLSEQPAEVHVFDGLVTVGRSGQTKPAQELTAGRAVQISAQGEVRELRADRRTFVSAEELWQRETTELNERFAAWQETTRGLAGDPALRIYYDFENLRENGRLPNRAGVGRDGEVIGGNWVEGRWSGKRSLAFGGVNDRVRLAAPGKCKSLTYLAWVRVDRLPNDFNALALSATYQRGEVHWQIQRGGRVEFSVRANDQAHWEKLASSEEIVPERFGCWLHLAAVYDGSAGRMALYLNGQLVVARTLKRPVPLDVGPMELGNWTPVTGSKSLAQLRQKQPSYYVREFHGRMDEFAMLARPLSDEEIRREYERGKRTATTTLAAAKDANSHEKK